METQVETQTIAPDDLAKVVAKLDSEQLQTVYEFASFLALRTIWAHSANKTGISSPSSAFHTIDEMDDVAWMVHLAASETSELEVLRKQAMIDIETGNTTPMFNDVGEMITE